jgi:two-component system, OmpR family, alkaline phosphatase synthesis response regulator PhoP
MILVVEDEAAISELLMFLFEDEGYQVTLASNGAQALERLTLTTPDLIITDLMMPIMNGLDFCHRLEADSQYREIPRVLLSAVSDRPKYIDGMWSAVIDKPFDVNELLSVVTRFI